LSGWNGIFEVIGNTKLTAVFIIDDVRFVYAGNLGVRLKNSISRNAVLRYDTTDDLIGNKQHNGAYGPSRINISFVQGTNITISGDIAPDLGSKSTATGFGTWTSD